MRLCCNLACSAGGLGSHHHFNFKTNFDQVVKQNICVGINFNASGALPRPGLSQGLKWALQTTLTSLWNPLGESVVVIGVRCIQHVEIVRLTLACSKVIVGIWDVIGLDIPQVATRGVHHLHP